MTSKHPKWIDISFSSKLPPYPLKKRKRAASLERTTSEADFTPPNVSSPKSLQLTTHGSSAFINLPFEIRLLIYRLLFKGSNLVLDRSGFGYMEFSLSHENNLAEGLLRCCKIIRQEALPVLMEETNTLCVRQPASEFRHLALLPMQQDWRARITTIQYGVIKPRLHLYLPQFANLQAIALGVKLYHIPKTSMPIEKNVAAKVLQVMEKEHLYLKGHGEQWIQAQPHIKVIIRALLHNRNDENHMGWDVKVNVANWEVDSIAKARITARPFDETQLNGMPVWLHDTARRRWRRKMDGWKVEVIE